MTLVYEDGVVQAHLKTDGAAVGHIVVTPKTAAKTLDELPQAVAVQLWYCASFAATAVYEGLGAHGTNILCYEGDSVELHVLPRQAQDGISLTWDASPADPGGLETTAKRIKEQMWYVGKESESQPRKIAAPSEPKQPSPSARAGPDQRIVHLRRRP